jgi:hypothetical protein
MSEVAIIRHFFTAAHRTLSMSPCQYPVRGNGLFDSIVINHAYPSPATSISRFELSLVDPFCRSRDVTEILAPDEFESQRRT